MEVILARSKAGHDKGKLYFVYSNGDENCLVVDGKYHRILKPKKKNNKHIQIIKNIPDEVKNIVKDNAELRDSDIIKIIRTYERGNNTRSSECQKPM